MSDIASERTELVYDYDLDELTIHVFGRSRRHTVLDGSGVSSLLVDRENSEIVGVVIRNFMHDYLGEQPGAMVLLERAIIIAGDEVHMPSDGPYESLGRLARLKEAVKLLLNPSQGQGTGYKDEISHALKNLVIQPALSS